MTSITLDIPERFTLLVSDNEKKRKITNLFVEEYLTELYQDNKTKTELENNPYDIELNNKLKKALGI